MNENEIIHGMGRELIDSSPNMRPERIEALEHILLQLNKDGYTQSKRPVPKNLRPDAVVEKDGKVYAVLLFLQKKRRDGALVTQSIRKRVKKYLPYYEDVFYYKFRKQDE